MTTSKTADSQGSNIKGNKDTDALGKQARENEEPNKYCQGTTGEAEPTNQTRRKQASKKEGRKWVATAVHSKETQCPPAPLPAPNHINQCRGKEFHATAKEGRVKRMFNHKFQEGEVFPFFRQDAFYVRNGFN